MSVFLKVLFAVSIGGFVVGNTAIALWLAGSVLRVSLGPGSIMTDPLPVVIAVAKSSVGAIVFATYTPIATLSVVRLFSKTRGFA